MLWNCGCDVHYIMSQVDLRYFVKSIAFFLSSGITEQTSFTRTEQIMFLYDLSVVLFCMLLKPDNFLLAREHEVCNIDVAIDHLNTIYHFKNNCLLIT